MMAGRLLLAVLLVAGLGCRRPADAIEAAPELAPAVAPKPSDGPLAASVVITAGDRRFVVLDPKATVGDEADLGPATFVANDLVALVATVVRAAPTSLPALHLPTLRDHGVRHAVRLYGDGGRATCDGTLGAPMFLVRADVETPAAAANEVWERAGAPVLVAEVESAKGCGAALWARDRSLAEPAVGFAGPADAALTARAIAAVRALPAYAEVQKRFVAEVAAPRAKHWEEHDGAAARVVLLSPPGASYVWVAMETNGGCGDFGGSLAVLLRDDGSTLRVVHEGTETENDPVALIGEAQPTVMFPDARLTPNGDYEAVKITHFGCSC